MIVVADSSPLNYVERGAAEVKEESRQLGSEIKEESAQAGRAVADAAITSAVKAKFLVDTTVKGLKIDVDTDAVRDAGNRRPFS